MDNLRGLLGGREMNKTRIKRFEGELFGLEKGVCESIYESALRKFGHTLKIWKSSSGKSEKKRQCL